MVRKYAFRVHLISRIKSLHSCSTYSLSRFAGYGPQIVVFGRSLRNISFEPMVQMVVRILIHTPCYNSRLAGHRRRRSCVSEQMIQSGAPATPRTVMTPANVRIALHCNTDAVLHFALMLIDLGLGLFPPRRFNSNVRLFPPRSCNVRLFPPGRHRRDASARKAAPPP